MTMRQVWKLGGGLHFYDLGVGIILAEFDEENDNQRVVRDGPWNFDKRPLLTKEFEVGMQVKDLTMKEASIWCGFMNYL